MSTPTRQDGRLSPEEKRALLASLLKQKEARPRVFPASFAQQRLWFIDRLRRGDPLYNIPLAVRLDGPFEIVAFRRALTEVARRHESLRTTFASADGQPVQIISPRADMPLPLIDLSGLAAGAREAEALRVAAAEARRPFDLARGPVLRCLLLRLGAREHAVVLTTHHIISDGWSRDILLREMTALYGAYSRGAESPLTEPPLQYADYAVWQREWLRGERLEKQLAYWRDQLAGAPPVLELPTDRPRPAAESHRGASHSFTLDAALYEGLKELSRREGATLFMTLLAAFQLLLSRYTGQTDLVVGTVIAGRNRAETEGLIGFFVNTLALRAQVGGDPSFVEMLRRARATCLGAYAHQDVPFEKLVEELRPERSLSHAPLFQVTFVLQNTPHSVGGLPGLRMRSLVEDSPSAKFDLMLTMDEGAHGLGGALTYKTDLFDAATIRRMSDNFGVLLAGVVADPAARLSELPLLTDEERRRLLVDYNDTGRHYPRHLCAHQLFEQQVRRTPDSVALTFEGAHLTYAELNARANRLAHHLLRRGVGPDSRVALMLERSLGLVVSLLGVLKAGGCYVPLDPDYPRERLSFMLADSAAALLLTDSRLPGAGPAAGWGGEALCLDLLADELAGESDADPRFPVDPANLAYLIYTSGSTGHPKGVMVTHAALSNHMLWMLGRFPLSGSDSVLLKTPVSFDASVWEFFAPLLSGARLLAARAGGHRDAGYLAGLVGGGRVTVAQMVPALWRAVCDEAGVLGVGGAGGRLRLAFSGGEALGGGLARRVREATGAEVYNLYGPTEAAIDATCGAAREGATGGVWVPIGRPVANTRCYVVGRWGELAPEGAAGELYVGGAQVARGYWNRPGLTAERFVPDPYGGEPGARLYRTGDVVRYLAGGVLDFVGRCDQQVKLRGHRVELGEVEAALCEHPRVRECAAAVTGEGERRRLVAYVVARGEGGEGGRRNGGEAGGGGPDAAELRRFLSGRLPGQMVPSQFVTLDALPLTPNGKVDRRALPEPGELGRGESLVMARNAVELRLTRVWEEVLGVRPVGIKDDFFQSGGHSLLAVRLVTRIEQAFGKQLPLSVLYRGATVEDMAVLLGREAGAGRGSLVRLQEGGPAAPFCCVHPAGGNVFCYVELARRFGTERPFYGLQARGLDGGAPHTRVEEMAAHYVGELRAVQPEGPYLLGGWSFGGVVAFEMARQLRERGQRVSLLALLDSFVPRPAADGRGDEAARLLSFARHVGLSPERLHVSRERIERLDRDERLGHVLELAKAADLLPPDIERAHVSRLWEVFEANLVAARDYVPRPYAGRVTLVRAGANAAGRDQAGEWAPLARGGLEVLTVPGDHFSFVREPHAGALAEALRACLERAREV